MQRGRESGQTGSSSFSPWKPQISIRSWFPELGKLPKFIVGLTFFLLFSPGKGHKGEDACRRVINDSNKLGVSCEESTHPAGALVCPFQVCPGVSCWE
jgi:hypothetical protein